MHDTIAPACYCCCAAAADASRLATLLFVLHDLDSRSPIPGYSLVDIYQNFKSPGNQWISHSQDKVQPYNNKPDSATQGNDSRW
ncbi:hypothetical protein FPSE_09502 [Fusarium pseudograminearum CS3096]|uniref:Uncharacterized protein n=1 Tax=Fusarium pseudograminearum (strain CS3096) TaxID=1028729 RepID=K3VYA0_FUSPC|nr:hypothetical protein FPSE_09502 [Fusarium pseudograminearum CS3096]EKJ70285.1 hypothetical protein FPSE_09502 [Fusarium pseudograminearum CS3096]